MKNLKDLYDVTDKGERIRNSRLSRTRFMSVYGGLFFVLFSFRIFPGPVGFRRLIYYSRAWSFKGNQPGIGLKAYSAFVRCCM